MHQPDSVRKIKQENKFLKKGAGPKNLKRLASRKISTSA